MDLLDFDEEKEKAKQLLMDAFGKLDKGAMEAMEEWFGSVFGIGDAAFRVFNGEWNALDAMRQDSFRLVWLRFRSAWKKVYEPEHGDEE